jgi:hypothetical protein
MALGYGLDDRGSRVRFPAGTGIFLFTIAFRTALGPTKSPIQWVPGALSLGVKRPGCEADHSPPSSAEVKNAWSYTSTPTVRLHGVVLSPAQGQLYLLSSPSQQKMKYPYWMAADITKILSAPAVF